MKKTIERALLDLAAERTPLTFCPSEVARALTSDWRALMPEVRGVARELIARGKLDCLQRGKIVAIECARGPIRLRQHAKRTAADFQQDSL